MKKKKNLSEYAEYLSLGGEIAAGILIPLFLGYWADKYFGTAPWLLLLGCLVGITNIFILIFRLNDRLNKS